MRCIFATVVCLISCFAASAAGQSVGSAQMQVANQQPGFVRLNPAGQLRKGIDTWPLIANPQTPAEVHINAELTKDNTILAKAVRECDRDSRDWAAEAGFSAPKNENSTGDWSRKVEVTMTGPHFLGMVATDSWFCGGVHPDWDRTVLLFDLTSGRIAPWSTLLTKPAGWSLYKDSTSVGTVAEGVILPALKALSIENAVTDCKDAFNQPQAYLVWPDATRGILVAWPWEMSHAVQACAENISLTIAQARAMGFSEDLLQATVQAHRQYLATQAKISLKRPRRPSHAPHPH